MEFINEVYIILHTLLMLYIILVICTEGVNKCWLISPDTIPLTKHVLNNRNHHRQVTTTDLHSGQVSHCHQQVLASYVLKQVTYKKDTPFTL